MKVLVLLVIGVLCLGAGCAGVTTQQPGPSAENSNTSLNESDTKINENNTTITNKNSGISSSLVEIINARNKSSTAADNNVQFLGGEVLVVIELRSQADRSKLTESNVVITSEAGTFVQAWVPVERLTDLAGAEYVTFIRAPRTPSQSSLQQ